MAKAAFLALVLFVATAMAQDPPPGWLGYATANCPEGTRITKYEGKWKVGTAPPVSSAFYSPWIGMDTTDNLNLLQPVNPWFGSSWNFYTEYFQWSPENNVNSQQQSTSAGNILHGVVEYIGDEKYTITQTDTTTGLSSTQTEKVQKTNSGSGPGYKNYTVLYVVYEKVARCQDYPPDNEVLFYDLSVECDGKKIVPSWTTSYVEDVCNNRAHVVSPDKIKITWDVNSADPSPAQFARGAAKVQDLNMGKKKRV